MKKKGLYLIFLFSLLLLTLSNTNRVNSTGAPIGSTGAPGESNCARSGCHVGNNNVNKGIGTLKVNIENHNQGYINGKTYHIKVSLKQNQINRFGFAMVALNNDLKSIGNFEIKDQQRTQILAGSGPFEKRDYITYKALGTNPAAKHKGEWYFTWTAPKQNEGPIRIYVAGVAANNDGTDKGDEVYTDSLTFYPATTLVKQVGLANNKALYISPNPVKSAFTVKWNNTCKQITEITIEGLEDKNNIILFSDALKEGEQQIKLKLPIDIKNGIYQLNIRQGSSILTDKIIVNR